VLLARFRVRYSLELGRVRGFAYLWDVDTEQSNVLCVSIEEAHFERVAVDHSTHSTGQCQKILYIRKRTTEEDEAGSRGHLRTADRRVPIYRRDTPDQAKNDG